MVNDDEIRKISQKKMEALSAKHLHQIRLNLLKRQSTLVDCLAFIVPVLYFPVRYVFKGTAFQNIAEYIWEFMAAVLSALAIIKILYKWQEKSEKHSRLRDDNIKAVTEADTLLRHKGNLDLKDIEHFYTSMDKLEAEDREAFSQMEPSEKQSAYRESLKDFDPASAACPHCGASAWKFTSGGCQTCGNTPLAAHGAVKINQ